MKYGIAAVAFEAALFAAPAAFACTIVSTDIQDCGTYGIAVIPRVTAVANGAVDPSQGADQKLWDIASDAGRLDVRTLDDADATGAAWMQVLPSAKVPTAVDILPNLGANAATPGAPLSFGQNIVVGPRLSLGPGEHAPSSSVTQSYPAISTYGSVSVDSNDGTRPEDVVGAVGFDVHAAVIHNTSRSSLRDVHAFGAYGVNEAAQSGSGQYAGGNMVGLYADIVCRGRKTACWGSNPSIYIDTTAAYAAGDGEEIDVNNLSPSAAGAGLAITGNSSASGDASRGGWTGIAVQLLDQDGQHPGVKWGHDIYLQPGSSNIAIEVGQMATGGGQGSMPIRLDSSVGSATISADASGDIAMTGASLKMNGAVGLTTSVNVRDSAGGAPCTLTFTGGLLTASSCPDRRTR